MTTELTISAESAAFELVQRQAKMLASSTLIPNEFQGNMANCAIGLNIAKRLGADPFMVLQNVDIIHGRPSFRASFLIAMVNASGRFTPLQFRLSGEGDKRGCIAYSTNKETGEMVEGPEVTMAMAKAEGWSTKAGSKWPTMPELMLRYRSAAFFARIYAPDITLGMQTSEELGDMPVEPKQATGRVIESEVNPFAERKAIGIEAAPDFIRPSYPVADPDPTPPPTTEREAWLDRIEEVGLAQDPPLKLNQIESMCRKAGVLTATGTLKGAKEDRLAGIHTNFAAIIAKAGEEGA